MPNPLFDGFDTLGQFLTKMARRLVLARRIDALEERYDGQFKEVFDAIDEMMFPTDGDERRIGFRTEQMP